MSDRNRHQRGIDGGFTLLEVVVAMALLGLVLTAAFGLLGGGLRSLKVSREYTRGVLMARQKLAEILLDDLAPGVVDGGSTGGYRWSAEVVPEGPDDAELPARLFKLRVRVSWPGRAQEKSVELVTLSAAVDEGRLDRPLRVTRGASRR